MALAQAEFQQIETFLYETFPAIFASQDSPGLSARYEIDLRERIVRVEEELRNQRELMQEQFKLSEKRFEDMHKYMDKRFEQVDKRFEDMHKYMDKRFEDMNAKFRMMFTFMSLGFTSLAVMMALFKFLG